jgi:hypothetical protein
MLEARQNIAQQATSTRGARFRLTRENLTKEIDKTVLLHTTGQRPKTVMTQSATAAPERRAMQA